MNKLEKYFELQQEIYDYFGYVEDYLVLPIQDSRGLFWHLGYDEVCFAESEDELENECGSFDANEVYRQHHLPRCVYEGEKHTMVVVDTHADGNRFLQLFSNAMKRN